MTKDLEKAIKIARPNLKVVTPLAHAILSIYALFNIALGISFILALDQARITAPLLIVNDIFTYDFWGFVFVSIGILKIYSIKTNTWKLSRQTLLVGVATKATWAIALIVRSITSPGTWLVTIMWLALALIQIATFIFFMPPNIQTSAQPEPRDGE
jgi:hypothetical protein